MWFCHVIFISIINTCSAAIFTANLQCTFMVADFQCASGQPCEIKQLNSLANLQQMCILLNPEKRCLHLIKGQNEAKYAQFIVTENQHLLQ